VAAITALAVAVAVAALVAGRPPGRDEGWELAPLAAAVAGALAVWPFALRGARRVADRTVRRSRRSPAELMRSVGATSVADELRIDEVLADLTDSFARAFGAASAEIWVEGDDGEQHRRASLPSAPIASVRLDRTAAQILGGGAVVGRAWAELWAPQLLDGSDAEVRIAPAAHGGRLRGFVLLRRTDESERFTTADDVALGELGARLGLVLHNWQLDAALRDTLDDLRRTNADLRASRERLVATADAERRRFERNLHDGAQQHLVALAVNLKLASAEIAADPSTAPALFATLADDVREAINEVRSLAHGIYPPLLMDAGVVEALRVSARRSPSAVTVTASGVGRYPTELEAAAYFCCMEALQNASKHAPGAAVRVHVAEDQHELRIVVEDDGPGIAADRIDAGQGIGNMRDRIGAVGGELTITRPSTGESRGTTITATIPLRDPIRVEPRA